jgi:hypothetical protein
MHCQCWKNAFGALTDLPDAHMYRSSAHGNPASAYREATMAALTSTSVKNNPSLKGSLAAPKQFFGESRRYAVAPVHTRFDAVEWFVWDAEHPLSDMSHAEVIRQAPTIEKALRGL